MKCTTPRAKRRLLFAAAALVLVGCSVQSNTTARSTIHGTASSSEKLWLHGGVLDIEYGSRRPAVALGMVKRPGAKREFSYVLLMRYPPKHDGIGIGGNAISTEQRKGIEDHQYKLGRHWISVRYELEVDPNADTVVTESLSVQGEPADLDSGRVFLVDATGETPRIRQIDVHLPADLPLPDSVDVIKELIEQLLRTLPRQSREIRDFIRSQEISKPFHLEPFQPVEAPKKPHQDDRTDDTTPE